MIRVATYVRVSTADQHVENQAQELRRYVEARGWTVWREYSDSGVLGAAQIRPALDELLRDAKWRRFDAVIVWSLDRLGRNLKHLITLLDDFQALGIAFISLREGLDWTTPAGRLQGQLLAMISPCSCSHRQKAFIARTHVLQVTGFRPRSRRWTTNC